jgi:hypothetical protein
MRMLDVLGLEESAGRCPENRGIFIKVCFQITLFALMSERVFPAFFFVTVTEESGRTQATFFLFDLMENKVSCGMVRPSRYRMP